MDALFRSGGGDYLTAVDLETKGTDASHPDSEIVGIGIADEAGNFYLDLRNAPDSVWSRVAYHLSNRRLVAHNVLFDSAFLEARFPGIRLHWQCCTFGLYKQLATEGHIGQRWGLKHAQTDVLGWSETNEIELTEWLAAEGLGRADMWKAPPTILGKYCALDAEACWLLFLALNEDMAPFPELRDYHAKFLTNVKLIVEQQLRGMAVDTPALLQYQKDLEDQIEASRDKFLTDPAVGPHVKEYEREAYVAYKERTPKGRLTPDNKRFRFNPNSKQQLRWLFFDRLHYQPIAHTERGAAKVDKKVLPLFGDPGKALTQYNKLVKELGYVSACVGSTRDGFIHPQFRAPGTLTGRLAGSGGFNIQQQPKTRGYLRCLRARPGYKLVQLDFAAVEPVVLAEFSEDPALMAIYGPDAGANDIYLYTAAKITGLGDRIKRYYDPDSPTAEGIELAKKFCKDDRAVAKVVVLASNYNAGPGKIHETLRLAGFDVTFEEVARIHREYWQLYAGVKRFQRTLEQEWTSNKGWIRNGLGRPLSVAPHLKKDLVNRFCQSTGHDLLVEYLAILQQRRPEGCYPVISDFHDETIWEAPVGLCDTLATTMASALDQLNERIQGTIPIKGEPEVADTFADIKIA